VCLDLVEVPHPAIFSEITIVTFSTSNLETMKTVAALTLLTLSGASAFAPSASSRQAVSVAATAAEIEALPGKSLETGNKVVSSVVEMNVDILAPRCLYI
jgi:hypothetical protein